jgi:hypothetical protein
MSSDNVFEQVEALIASDERQGLPESVDAILNRIAKLPLAGPIVWAARYESEKQRAENSQLMLTTMWEELKRISFDVEEFRKDHPGSDEAGRLVLDGMRKAEDLRDRKRVERIGKILAHAITLAVKDFDKAEEMMRVARDLSDQDVLALRYLYDHQFQYLNGHGWKLDEPNLVHTSWREDPPKIPVTPLPGEVDSLFLKLQALGLCVLVADQAFQPIASSRAFALLPKGADFVRYIHGAVGTDSTASTKGAS